MIKIIIFMALLAFNSFNSFGYYENYGINACLGCHPNKSISKSAHGGIAKECFNCHGETAKSTGFRYNLIEADINKLCFSCHDQFESPFGSYGSVAGGHPVAKHPVGGGPDKLYPKRDFTCASCHNPHGSPMRKMFRYEVRPQEDLCQICHGEIVFGRDHRTPIPPWELI